MSVDGSGMVRSMTGFSNVEISLDDGRRVAVRVKGVNGRHLELQVRLPGGLDSLEPQVRALVKGCVRRGHVEMTVFAERAEGSGAVRVDHGLLAAYVDAHRQAADLYSPGTAPDLAGLLRVPGVLTARVAADFDEHAIHGVLAASAKALEAFNQARQAEGGALAVEMSAAVGRLRHLAEEATELRREVSVSAVERLRARIADLAGEVVEVSAERVIAEAALLVARGDVEEELVRLQTHLQRFLALLAAGGEVGKPLEFLLQELNREANTMLSKTVSAAGAAGLRLTDVGLAMKVELERLREQVQNLE